MAAPFPDFRASIEFLDTTRSHMAVYQLENMKESVRSIDVSPDLRHSKLKVLRILAICAALIWCRRI